MTPAKPSSRFTRFTKSTAHATGQPKTFALAVGAIAAWAVTGPMFGFSDTWQLIVNTGTTIITFLMVFLIQSTQNRDSEALQIKLDELLRVTPGAHNVLMNLEELEERDLARLRAVYIRLAERARRGAERGRSDETVPAIDELTDSAGPPPDPAPANRPSR
jgi:low affinity Fe/Cu permease